MLITLANWRTAPFNHWAFHHVRELVPSADIPNDPAKVRTLPAEPMDLGLGIHGQNLFVDRVNRIVIAKFSSQAQPLDAGCIGLTMKAVSQIRNVLAGS